MAYNQARSGRAMAFSSGHYQGTFVAFKESFANGALVGASLGLVSAIYYRRFSLIPKYAVVAGTSFGSVMTASQMYRMDL